MGKELTLHEMNELYPSSSSATKMKKWFNSLMTSAKIDLSSFFAEDKHKVIPINGKQYEIYLRDTDLKKLRGYLNKGDIPNPAGSEQIYFNTFKTGQPIIIEYMSATNKLIFSE